MPMSDLLAWQLPIQVDIGLKVRRDVFVGGYAAFSYGRGAGGYPCDTAWEECSALDARVGFQAQYHVRPDGTVNPWIGYGVGVESLRVDHVEHTSASPAEVAYEDTGRAFGVEFARIDLGLDVRLSHLVGAGAFVSCAAGDYLSASVDSPASKGAGLVSVFNRSDGAVHLWMVVGARIVLLP
jgi:hypothetical protein